MGNLEGVVVHLNTSYYANVFLCNLFASLTSQSTHHPTVQYRAKTWWCSHDQVLHSHAAAMPC